MRPPSVDKLARSLTDTGLPHPMLVDVAREAIAAGDSDSATDLAKARQRTLLQPVINATGVLLHTNLGRAPLAASTVATATNLEFDLATGKRGSRRAHAGSLLARAVGAEAGLIVNNGAAAVMLTLAALARGRRVAVSRGEMVEIGGGFRIPDVMAESGAELVEVGTTNRTRVADYERVAHDLALVMKVHRSNYRITGFTEEASISELSALEPDLVVDLGSGLLDSAMPWIDGPPPQWLRDEPSVAATVAAGAGLVIFSGDKLLGGPQAGVIVGRADLVDACGRHPLYRAFRPGGLVLAAMQDVALSYLDRSAGELPFWRMATASVDALQERAVAVVARAGRGRVVETAAVAGGGTLPGIEIPSRGIEVPGDRLDELRAGRPPIVGRVEANRTIVDLRTVATEDDGAVADALAALD